MKKNSKQQGIALIMVLLVVALITIIATGIASTQKLSTRRTENLLNNEQAYMYLLGAEDWAKNILAQDFKDNKTDSFKDDWATELPAIPVDGGIIKGKVTDLQARFNINNLLKAGNPDEVSINVLRNLFVEKDIPVETTDAIVDWLDKDLEPLANAGAEDDIYLGKPQPYRAANRFMVDASELVLINGLDIKKYSKISKDVVALPVYTPVNVNTAEALQISMLSKQISLSEAEDIVKARDKGGYKSVKEFLAQDSLKGKKIENSLLAVKSEYFLLQARSIIGQSKSELYSIIHRDTKGKVKVILRSQRRI